MTSPATESTPRRRRRRPKPTAETRSADLSERSSSAGRVRPRCAREGCERLIPRGEESRYTCCSFLCSSLVQELERSQRLSQATGDTEHWLAVVALNDAMTAYFQSDRRLYRAACQVGITDEQWNAIKNGATA